MIECPNCKETYECDPVDGKCSLYRFNTVLAVFQRNKNVNKEDLTQLKNQVEMHKPTFEALQVTEQMYMKDIEFLLSEINRKDKEHREDRIRESKRIINLEVENGKLQKELEGYCRNANQWNHEHSKERDNTERLERTLKSTEEENEHLKKTIKELESKLQKPAITEDDIKYTVSFYNRQLKRLDDLLEEILDDHECSLTTRGLIEEYYEE